MESNSIFDWNGQELVQDARVHKITTDALLLGGWVSSLFTEVKSCLDAGTGTGILAIMIGHAFRRAKIDAIDIDDDAVALAGTNIMRMSMEKRVRASKSDLADVDVKDVVGYDLIVSNPPFYTQSLLPTNPLHLRAKHAVVPIDQWMKGLLRLLVSDGHLCVIVPADKAGHWIAAANETGYFVHHRLEVYSTPSDSRPVRSLLHFGMGLTRPERSDLIIYTEERLYTSAYMVLTSTRKKT